MLASGVIASTKAVPAAVEVSVKFPPVANIPSSQVNLSVMLNGPPKVTVPLLVIFIRAAVFELNKPDGIVWSVIPKNSTSPEVLLIVPVPLILPLILSVPPLTRMVLPAPMVIPFATNVFPALTIGLVPLDISTGVVAVGIVAQLQLPELFGSLSIVPSHVPGGIIVATVAADTAELQALCIATTV